MLRTFLTTLALAGTLFLLAGCAGPTGSQPPPTDASVHISPNGGTPAWARIVSASSGSLAKVNGTAADRWGNLYAVGVLTYAGTFDFGNAVTATTAVTITLFVVKYSAAGKAQWVSTAAAYNWNSTLNAVTTDSAGNVYAAGSLTGAGTMDFGNEVTFDTAVYTAALLVKYNAAGDAQWAKTQTNGTGGCRIDAVAVDANGVYTAGATWAFQAEALPSATQYTLAGIPVWNTTLTAFSDKEVATGQYLSVAADRSGNVYAAGKFRQTDSEATYPLLTRFSSEGSAVWTQNPSFDTELEVNSQYTGVAVDASGGVYAAGWIGYSGVQVHSLSLGSVVVETKAVDFYINPLLVKYDSSGEAQWGRTVDVIDRSYWESQFKGLVLDDEGHLYVCGFLYQVGDYRFGNGVTASTGSNGNYTPLLACYDNTGAAQWVRTAATESTSAFEFKTMAMAASGAIVLTGVMAAETIGFGAEVSATSTRSDTPLLVQYN